MYAYLIAAYKRVPFATLIFFISFSKASVKLYIRTDISGRYSSITICPDEHTSEKSVYVLTINIPSSIWTSLPFFPSNYVYIMCIYLHNNIFANISHANTKEPEYVTLHLLVN